MKRESPDALSRSSTRVTKPGPRKNVGRRSRGHTPTWERPLSTARPGDISRSEPSMSQRHGGKWHNAPQRPVGMA